MKSKSITVLILIFLVLWSVPMPAAAVSETTISEVTEMLNTVEMSESAGIPETTETPNVNTDAPIQSSAVVTSEKSDNYKIDASTITAIASTITAIAAIITPNVTSIMKTKSEERKARFEQYSPQIYVAIDEFTTAYSKFHRFADYTSAGEDYQATLDDEVLNIYKNFCAAAYKVISLIPSRDIREQIIILLETLEEKRFVSDVEDSYFYAILADLAHILSP